MGRWPENINKKFFLLLLVLQTHKNQGLFGKGLMTLRKTPFINIVGKAKNAGN